MPAAAAGKRQPATCTNRRGRAQNTRTTSFWGSGGPVVRGKRQGNARFPSAVKTGTHCENPPSHASTFYRALAHNTHKHLRRTTRKKEGRASSFSFLFVDVCKGAKKNKKKTATTRTTTFRRRPTAATKTTATFVARWPRQRHPYPLTAAATGGCRVFLFYPLFLMLCPSTRLARAVQTLYVRGDVFLFRDPEYSRTNYPRRWEGKVNDEGRWRERERASRSKGQAGSVLLLTRGSR